jgi:hypothetical protein
MQIKMGWMAMSFAAAAVTVGAEGAMLRFSSLLGTEGLGSYDGEVNWTAPIAGSGGPGTFVLTLTNTSAPSNGGYLTGFAFNLVEGLTPDFLEDAAVLPEWEQLTNPNVPPWGIFSTGAAVGGNWLGSAGSGGPDLGIAVGESWQFTFNIYGDEEFLRAIELEEMFYATDSYEFAARFRGFNDEGSDKVPARLPAPGAIAVLALAGLVGRRARSTHACVRSDA